MTIEPDITSRMNQSTNPWNVSDASVFLKYCCPECDYINLNLPEFSQHALEYHAQSIALFDPTDNQGYKNRYNLVDCDIKKICYSIVCKISIYFYINLLRSFFKKKTFNFFFQNDF